MGGKNTGSVEGQFDRMESPGRRTIVTAKAVDAATEPPVDLAATMSYAAVLVLLLGLLLIRSGASRLQAGRVRA
jgi:hypothetical protein